MDETDPGSERMLGGGLKECLLLRSFNLGNSRLRLIIKWIIKQVVATQRFFWKFHPEPWGFMIRFDESYSSNGLAQLSISYGKGWNVVSQYHFSRVFYTFSSKRGGLVDKEFLAGDLQEITTLLVFEKSPLPGSNFFSNPWIFLQNSVG